MSAEPPPSGGNAGFNPDDWTNANDPVDNQFLAANYLQFPLAQGTETLANTIVSGELTVQNNSTFADLATFNNGIDITTTAGIKFSDTTVQTTAFVEANYAQLNTDNIFLPTFTNTFDGLVNLGTNATATTQVSGNNSTFVATTAFVQDAVQVSGVQVGDTPLLWTGANTWRLNAGTPSQLAYSYPYGISNLWNVTAGGGDCDLVCNSGTGVQSSAFRIYCIQGNKTGTEIAALTPQLILSNNNTAMFVNDGINIPSGETYAINGINILDPYSTTAQMNSAISTSLTPYSTTTQMNTAISTALTPYSTTTEMNSAISTALTPYSTTTEMNSAISTALTPYATKDSPALTGTPTAPTQALGDNSTAIATTAFVLANSDPAPVLTNYAQLNTSTAQTFTGVVNFTNQATAITQSPNTNNTRIATTAFVQSLIPIYTSGTYSQSLSSCTMTPTNQNFTSIQTNLTTVIFSSSTFSLLANNVLNPPTFAKINFSVIPWPLFPPTGSYYINGVDTITNISYSFPIIFATATTYYMQISLPSGAPYTSGTKYTFNLQTIGSILA